MSKRTVHYELDPTQLPPLTEQQKAKLEALQALPDSAIDYSDIPPLTDEFWKNAVRNPFYKPTKTSTTVRLDSDVLLWLKSKGKGYRPGSTLSCGKRCYGRSAGAECHPGRCYRPGTRRPPINPVATGKPYRTSSESP
jgi:uncharacterized protein (DUF4415 family)